VKVILAKIRSSSQRVQAFNEQCQINGLKPLRPKRNVDTRWSSMRLMLEFVNEYALAINGFVIQDRLLDTAKFKLTDVELGRIKKLLKHTTVRFAFAVWNF